MNYPRNFHHDFACFLNYFSTATAAIGNDYMLLPIAGAPLPIYRERVYCYELYHQLRVEIDMHKKTDDFPYSLGGEVDKRAHPIMRGLDIDNAKPDLLVHTPGDMEGNLIIIEVKPVNANKYDIRKDLRTLTAFRKRGKYRYAMYLIYGSNERWLSRVKRNILQLQTEDEEQRIDLSLIDLYVHRFPETPAEHVDWYS
jgi:hypothetical protein